MKKQTKRITKQETRRNMRANVLPAIRKLVTQFDLASVQSAVKVLYDERAATRELEKAEAKVEALKKKLL